MEDFHVPSTKYLAALGGAAAIDLGKKAGAITFMPAHHVPISFPAFVVQKGDKPRVTDIRAQHEKTLRDYYPMQSQEQTFQMWQGAKYIFVFDATRFY